MAGKCQIFAIAKSLDYRPFIHSEPPHNMPLLDIAGLTLPVLNFDLADEYWPGLTALVYEQHGDTEIKNDSAVQAVLKACFAHLGGQFMTLIQAESRASFYLTVHEFHENSFALWKLQSEGHQLDLLPSDLAAIRRVLKIVLEQGCAHDWSNHADFRVEAQQHQQAYLATLERMLYLGYWAIGIADYIARSQLFPGSIGVQIQEGELSILTYQPQQEIFKYIDADLPKHGESVIVQHTFQELKALFRQQLNIDYDRATAFLAHKPNGLALVNPEQLLPILVQEGAGDEATLRRFFAGLTVSAASRLSFADCILRNQDSNRYTYRPILQVTVAGEPRWLLGPRKWDESFTTLTTNALPFALCPEEWLQFPVVRQFADTLRQQHDQVLEQPLRDLLAARRIPYDANVTSLRASGGNIPIAIAGVGEIDILFLDLANQIVYVCECKHNRARFDYPNWRRDYSNFVDTYERKLTNKVNWVGQNLGVVEEHFRALTSDSQLSLAGFSVQGVFAINAPTIYMYNGKYRAFTIHEFRALLDDEYRAVIFQFENEDTGQVLEVAHPYFVNLALLQQTA